MKDRIRILWAIYRLHREHPEIKHRFKCVTEEGCTATVSSWRFFWIGCECKMHSWFRRWMQS